MTDQPRGAYTPQQDVPLQFDPRSPASRRPLPMALIASGALLVVLVAAVGMYYSRGVRGDNEPPRPVGEPVAVLKAAPSAEAQPTDPNGSLDVAAPQNVPGKAPVFAAAPEQPKPRPALPAPTKLTVQTLSASEMGRATSATVAAPPVVVAAAKAPVVKTIAAAPVVAPAPETPDAPVVTAKTLTAKTVATKPVTAAPKVAVATTTSVATTTTVPTKVAAAKVTTAAPVKTPATASAATATGVRVQIGAFSSSALADKGYSDVAALLSGSMSGKAKHVEPVPKDGQTLYRTSVTGFSDRASAAAFCDSLKAKGKICFVKS